jgi:ubiquinone/menaquinone biosynthesis C-methylase UbiE
MRENKEYLQSIEIAYEYDKYYEGLPLFELDTKILDLYLKEKGKILDLGCGTGRHLLNFAQKGFKVVGVDLSFYMLKKAKEKDKNLNLVQGDICNLKIFKDESFHYSICMYSTLGMIKGNSNRESILKEVGRILKRKGIFILHVYNRLFGELSSFIDFKHYLKYFIDLEPGDLILKEFRGVRNFYLHKFTTMEVKRMLKKANLNLKEIIYINDKGDKVLENLFKRITSESIIFIATKENEE